MTEERKRILRMLAEGTVSVDECEELLHALSDRKTERVEREVQAAKGNRPAWPYVLIVILVLLALPTWGLGVLRIPGLFLGLMSGAGILWVAAIIFWIAMLVDCIKRQKEDFRLLFTQDHEHEKWIWCAVVILGNWVGALAYFIVIRQPSQSIAPPVSRRVQVSESTGDAEGEAPQAVSQATPQVKAKPEEPYTPSPRARSLWAFAIWGILLSVAVALLPPFCLNAWPDVSRSLGIRAHHFRSPESLIRFSAATAIAVFLLWALIFWIWMLIDCLARDYREFGTLVSDDKSLDKILWLLLVLFIPVIGGLAYHISIRRRPRPKARDA